ncbi:winged helix-turn-helix transcriptional regulator [Agromyces sp. NPDC058110]|uniref:winged helix-turn-helix transcriptional regulator n=1 Tax=Agromyces sp. NPDC058110 TaxID=3346345 RepID=UPI0036D8EE56
MRTYSDACGVARAMDLVGERWALLVVRELLLGPKRYADLASALPGISTNVLGARLTELAESGVLRKRRLAPPTPVDVYELTPWGADLREVVLALGRWGARTPLDPSRSLSPSSFALSLLTNFDPAAAEGVEARFAVTIGGERFVGVLADRGLSVERDDDSGVDLELDVGTGVGAGTAVAPVFYLGRAVEEAERQGLLVVRGRRDLLPGIIGCFPLPEPARPDDDRRLAPTSLATEAG